MTKVDDLQGAQRLVLERLEAIGPDRYDRPTPCSEWKVRDLAMHLLAGSGRAPIALGGGAAAPDLGEIEDVALVEALRSSFSKELAAFSSEGALERTFTGPRGEMDGSFLLELRTVDTLLHAWDLGEALGLSDNELPNELVQCVWATVSSPPFEPMLSSGAFGEGPSGTLGEDEPLTARLLDRSGRRPTR